MKAAQSKKPDTEHSVSGLYLVGAIGLEPTTPTMSRKGVSIHRCLLTSCFDYIFIRDTS